MFVIHCRRSVSIRSGPRVSRREREIELAELGDEFAHGIGGRPVLVGDAHHDDAAVLVGEILGYEPHQVLGDAEVSGHGRGGVNDADAWQPQAA